MATITFDTTIINDRDADAGFYVSVTGGPIVINFDINTLTNKAVYREAGSNVKEVWCFADDAREVALRRYLYGQV